MGKITTAIVSAALAVGALFGYVASVTTATSGQLSRPGLYCAEEDDCAPQYDGATGQWTIVRTPH